MVAVVIGRDFVGWHVNIIVPCHVANDHILMHIDMDTCSKII